MFLFVFKPLKPRLLQLRHLLQWPPQGRMCMLVCLALLLIMTIIINIIITVIIISPADIFIIVLYSFTFSLGLTCLDSFVLMKTSTL